MKLKTLAITYNNTNYINYDGTPPHTYSAKISLETKMGETTVILDEQDIATIISVVAHKVAKGMVELASTVYEDIRLSVVTKASEHIVEEVSEVDDLPF